MNKMITSREELLKQAKEIIDEKGSQNLNMRELSKKCGIAIGSVYNYFPSKSDLVFALVEDFWKTIFKPENFCLSQEVLFVDFIDELYCSFAKHLGKFRAIYAEQMSIMKSKDKLQGKQIEQTYLTKVFHCIRHALDMDKKICKDIWTEQFTKNDFSKFVFDNMFSNLIRGTEDCTYLKQIINRILYHEFSDNII